MAATRAIPRRRNWLQATIARRAAFALPLLVTGCMPNLSKLQEGEGPALIDQGSMAGSASAAGGAISIMAGRSAGGGAGASATAGGSPPLSAGGSSAMAGGSPPLSTGGSGATAGSAPTSAGAPAVCTPHGTDTCNGVDDDCNGIVDDGCPSGANTVYSKDLAAIGDSPGGDAFSGDCKDGALLVGVEVGMGLFLSQVRGLCRSVHLALSNDESSGYKVMLADEAELPAHPAITTDTTTKLECMDNETLVGVRISQQLYTPPGAQTMTVVIPKVWISCAKLTLTKQGGAYSINWQGVRELAAVSGSYATNMAWFEGTTVPDGAVATRLLGNSGAWIDRVGLGLSKIVVAVAH